MTDPVALALLAEAPAEPDGAIAVLDDAETALELARAGHRVRAHLDSAAERAAIDADSDVEWCDDPADAVRGVRLVLARLGKAVAALDDTAQLVAQHADPAVELAVAARAKHLRHSMNEVLERSFTEVQARRGVGKARALVAAGPRTPGRQSDFPTVGEVDLPDADGAEPPITLHSHGAVFAHGRLDAGTRALLTTRNAWPDAETTIDLGSGSGVLAVVAARRSPEGQVIAVDDSAAACRSTRATAAAAGVDVEMIHSDGLTAIDDGYADLIICNPPFHQGATKDSTPSMIMLADTGRVLRPGGELWCVYNAHLPYLPWLRQHVGSTTIEQRGRDYLVTRSARRA